MRTSTQSGLQREGETMRHGDWMAVAEEEYRRLGELLGGLTPDDWALPTDCTEWDVRDRATATPEELRRDLADAGTGGDEITLDAVEFCRILSGRAQGTGLLAHFVPF